MSRNEVLCDRCGQPRRAHRLGRWDGADTLPAVCPPKPAPGPAEPAKFPPETDARSAVPRPQLWAVADAARAFHGRAISGRIGSFAYVRAAEALELELARLPESVWRP